MRNQKRNKVQSSFQRTSKMPHPPFLCPFRDRCSVLVQQETREGAVLPAAAVDGAAVKPQPHLVTLEQLEDSVIAGGLVVRSAVIGIRGHHHLFVAHEVDVQGNADGKLQDVEDEDVSAGSGTGETAAGRVEHFAEVGVQQFEGDRLIQSARGEVGRAGGGESHAELVERVHMYRHHSVRALRCDGHFH